MLQIENVIVSGEGGPIRLLRLTFKLKIDRASTFMIWNECELKLKDSHLVVPFKVFDSPKFFGKEETIYQSVQVPLSRESIAFVEANRIGDLGMDVIFNYSYSKIDEQGAQTPAAILGFFTPVSGHNQTAHRISIPHSEWIKQLKILRWSEIELFEVDRRPLRQDRHLDAAATQLRQAESAFREGDYAATLSACVQAFDSLSKIEIAGTQQRGVDVIVYRCFRDPEKGARIKTLIDTIHALCKMGAKEQYPQTPFSRVETEAQLRLTLSLFELLSHQLAENSGPGISG